MKSFITFREDLASGRPAKKPVSSSLLKNMARDNEKALASGFMKLSPKERAKESKRLGEETFTPHDMWSPKGEKKFAKTEKEHLALKDKGWGHNNPNKSEDKDMCSCDCDCGKAICESCGKPKMQKDITELSTKTLANYTRKAVSPLSKKSIGNLASKGAHKLAHSDDFDAGEKEDMKSVQRAKGVIRATKKIAKRAQANESARDNYNPEISDKRTKEKLKKAGLPPESPKVNEAKKPVVHSTKKDSLKMIKIKYNSPIKTKVTDIGAGGKEYVRKDWSEGYTNKGMKADEKEPNTLPKMDAAKRLAAMRADRQKPYKKPAHGVFSEDKKKGLDGKECWDGYKQMGTKKKGGKTVDNCVKMKEEQIQIVTNLDFNESLGNLVTRGLDKVRASIKAGEKSSGYKVDPSKNNTNNPVSGSNIAKRLASQKKRK